MILNGKIFAGNMKKYIYLSLVILSILFFIFLVNSILINNLSNNQSENLTFIGSPTNFCYQETANVSTSCGGFSTGNYRTYNLVVSNKTYDGDWIASSFSSFDSLLENGTLWINYTKPTNSIESSLWQIADCYDAGSPFSPVNLSIPFSCWNQNLLQFRMISSVSDYHTYSDCYNGSTWINLRNTGDIDCAYITEEAMIWDYGTSRNLSISKYVNVTSATINLTGVYNNNSNFVFNINRTNIFNTSFDVHNNISAYFLDITGSSAPDSTNLSYFNDSNFNTNFDGSHYDAICSDPNINRSVGLYFNNFSFILPKTSDLKNVNFHLNFGKTISSTIYFGLSPGIYFQCYNWSSNSWTNFLTNSYQYTTSTNYSLSNYIPNDCFNFNPRHSVLQCNT